MDTPYHGYHGKVMGKSWESHGKVMGKSWETMDVSYGFSSSLIMFDLLILLGIRGVPSGKLT